ncbi:MAG: S1 RNA-binding domain-containing protein [Clostridia bacterium]|nr:S1 RNA-binding domain-containing protein [Clostridia bacterium]
MTDKRYCPEGMRMGSAENTWHTASRTGLQRAMEQERILEGIARMCDCATMTLRVDLGDCTGIIERDEAAYNHDGSETKDIAIITRVGKPICFKILRIEEGEGRPVAYLSRRAAQEECMREWVMHRAPGDILPAKITHLEPFGAFVDIGCGIVSLLTVDCISVSRISHPSERLTPGESIMAIVKSIDYETGRVYMTHRELLGTWEENVSRFAPTQTVSGIVRSIEPYGIFVELAPNLAGLAELREGVSVGDRCAVYIKSILPERMKIKLVIIDAHAESHPQKMNYFVDTAAVRHMGYWRYSPEGCTKLVETRFDPASGEG